MADLDTLRPEVREAVEYLDAGGTAWIAKGSWGCIRAELLRLATRNAELEAKATRDHDWITDLLAENQNAYAELAALKNENAQLRDVLADRDMDREMAAHANKELAALKARIAGSPRADGQRVFDLLCLPIEFDGTLALVKVEE